MKFIKIITFSNSKNTTILTEYFLKDFSQKPNSKRINGKETLKRQNQKKYFNTGTLQNFSWNPVDIFEISGN